jgi:parvulin-like peptidyl-prolyl isomerase
VNSLLDQAPDRESTLESFQEQLQSRYKDTLSTITVLNAQGAELKRSETATANQMANIKTQLTLAYKNLDYDKTESLLNDFLEARRVNTYARTYEIFIGKFVQSYTALNAYNKLFLDTIINNKEALIKDVTVVLPDSGNALLQKLDLVKTEADWKKLGN